MGKCMGVFLLAFSLLLPVLADECPTQDEFDIIVEREMFKFIHGRDWQSAVSFWKKKGVTDDMFVKSYIKIAKQNMDAPEGSEAHRKCVWSITNGIRVHASQGQLTNLVEIATKARMDDMRTAAISAYYDRTQGTSEFLDFAESVLEGPNVTVAVASNVFRGLSMDLKGLKPESHERRARILGLARRQIERGGGGIVSADVLLERNDPAYSKSLLRKKAVRSILSPDKSPILNARKDWREATMDRYRDVQKRLGE